MGTTQYGYQQASPAWFLSFLFDKPQGKGISLIPKTTWEQYSKASKLPRNENNGPLLWVNQHVGIDLRGSTRYVRIEGCSFRHFGMMADGAAGALPSATDVGCVSGATFPCQTNRNWDHAFNHSHAIYAQGFGIEIVGCTFLDITQGTYIKIDGNNLAVGRPDDVLGPSNAGYGEASHVISDCCFGPYRNARSTVPPVVFWVNTKHVDVKTYDGYCELTTVQLPYNAPKNVKICPRPPISTAGVPHKLPGRRAGIATIPVSHPALFSRLTTEPGHAGSPCPMVPYTRSHSRIQAARHALLACPIPPITLAGWRRTAGGRRRRAA